MSGHVYICVHGRGTYPIEEKKPVISKIYNLRKEYVYGTTKEKQEKQTLLIKVDDETLSKLIVLLEQYNLEVEGITSHVKKDEWPVEVPIVEERKQEEEEEKIQPVVARPLQEVRIISSKRFLRRIHPSIYDNFKRLDFDRNLSFVMHVDQEDDHAMVTFFLLA